MERINNLYPQKQKRRMLRKSMTEEERIMWSVLKKVFPEIQFRRQFGVGHYILDFYCPKFKLAIEIDGMQHLDNKEYDKIRDYFLNKMGVIVLRFWNDEVRKNLNGVILKIKDSLQKSS